MSTKYQSGTRVDEHKHLFCNRVVDMQNMISEENVTDDNTGKYKNLNNRTVRLTDGTSQMQTCLSKRTSK